MLLLLDHTGIGPAIENNLPCTCTYVYTSYTIFFFFFFSSVKETNTLHLVLPTDLLKHQVIMEKALRALLRQQFVIIAAKIHHAS